MTAERELLSTVDHFDQRTDADIRDATNELLVEAYEMLGREEDAARIRAQLTPDEDEI